MKGSILARPNLKLFVLAAILLLAVQDLLSRGHSQSTIVHARPRSSERVSDETLHSWLVEATQADELMLTTMVYDHGARKHSYELMAKEYGLKPA